MDALIVYHPYAVTTDPSLLARQAVSNRALEACRTGFVRGDVVCHEPCGTDDRYELGLRALWGLDTLLICEHDIAPTPAHLASLRACPEPLCAVPYLLYIDPAFAARWRTAWAVMQHAQTDGSAIVARTRAATETMAMLLTAPPDWAPDAPWGIWPFRVAGSEGGLPRWITTDDTWADWSSNGLLKISADWQRAHLPDWTDGTWADLDSRMSAWYRRLGQRVHLHWDAGPVDHHHRCACHPEPAQTA